MKEQEIELSVSEVRSRYARVFELVAELYNLVYSEKIGKKFDEIVEPTKELYDDKKINDFLYENLKELYDQYPTLLPGQVSKRLSEDEKKELDRLYKLVQHLNMIIKELNDLYGETAESMAQKMILDQDGFDDWLNYVISWLTTTYLYMESGYGRRTYLLYLWKKI